MVSMSVSLARDLSIHWLLTLLVPQQKLGQVTALLLTLLSEQQHQHFPGLLVRDVLPSGHADDLPLAELDHVVLVSLAELEQAGEGGELLALPGVPKQRGDSVNLNSRGLTVLIHKQ